MAHRSATTMPLDQAVRLGVGVVHREADFQGDSKFGFGLDRGGKGFQPTPSVGRVKGNRALDFPKGPADLDKGASWTGARGGSR